MPGMNDSQNPLNQPQHELKAISGAIIALVGAVLLNAVIGSRPSFPAACLWVISVVLLLVGLISWLYQFTKK